MCAKSTFFSLSGQAVEQNKRSQSLVLVSTPQRGKLFCFLFSDPIIVGLRRKVVFSRCELQYIRIEIDIYL